jgi:hypothetical protein
MATVTDTDIQQLKDLITAGNASTQQQIIRLEQRMELGFANIETKFAEVRGDIKILDSKFEERTKGFSQRLDGKELAQRNITTGLTVAIVGGLLLTLAKYLFFGINP